MTSSSWSAFSPVIHGLGIEIVDTQLTNILVRRVASSELKQIRRRSFWIPKSDANHWGQSVTAQVSSLLLGGFSLFQHTKVKPASRVLHQHIIASDFTTSIWVLMNFGCHGHLPMLRVWTPSRITYSVFTNLKYEWTLSIWRNPDSRSFKCISRVP